MQVIKESATDIKFTKYHQKFRSNKLRTENFGQNHNRKL